MLATLLRHLCLAIAACVGAVAADVVICRPERESFRIAAESLAAELGGSLSVRTVAANADLAADLAADPPRVLVAMDNGPVERALRLADATDPRLAGIPVVALMGLNLRQLLANHPQACGIAYEVPIFSIVSGYMQRTGIHPGRVLLVYRSSVHAAEVADATRQLNRIGVGLDAIDVERSARGPVPIERWLDRNLLGVVGGRNEAVIVMPDNALLNKRTLATWVQAALASQRPFLTGIGSLVDQNSSFCAFAATPDHERLGIQAADLVRQIINGSKPGDLGVEYLIGVSEQVDQRRLGGAPR